MISDSSAVSHTLAEVAGPSTQEQYFTDISVLHGVPVYLLAYNGAKLYCW